MATVLGSVYWRERLRIERSYRLSDDTDGFEVCLRGNSDNFKCNQYQQNQLF